MTTTTNMNRKQQTILNRVLDYVLFANHEVKEMQVEGNDWNNDVLVSLETGMVNDEGTMAEVFCRDYYIFHIGERGGLYFYNDQHNRQYIKYYEIYKTGINR